MEGSEESDRTIREVTLEDIRRYKELLFCGYTKGQIVPKKPSPAKDSTMAEMTPIYGSRNFEIK